MNSDSPAAVVAVTQLHCLERPGRRSRGHRGTAQRAGVQLDLDLDGRVATRVQDLPTDDALDDAHANRLLDERRGERVVAFVTVPAGAAPPELDELVAFCRERLARYKCPTELEIVTELPIGASGKTQRRKLS